MESGSSTRHVIARCICALFCATGYASVKGDEAGQASSEVNATPVALRASDVEQALGVNANGTRAVRGDTRIREVPLPRGGFIVVPEAAPHIDVAEKKVVLFDRDHADVREDAKPTLDELGKALTGQGMSGFNIQLEGHTCNLGSEEHNLQLSIRRAECVRDYLVHQWKIDPTHVRTVGYGESRPIASSASESERKQNRRVRLVRLEQSNNQPILTAKEFEAVRTRSIEQGGGGALVKCELWGTPSKNAGLRRLDSGTALPSGGLFQVRVHVLEGCHLYVVLRDSQGAVTFLLPDPAEENLPFGRWVDWQRDVVLPGPDRSYVLDHNPGAETLFILASRKPIADAAALTDLTDILRKSGTNLSPAALKTWSTESHIVRILHE